MKDNMLFATIERERERERDCAFFLHLSVISSILCYHIVRMVALCFSVLFSFVCSLFVYMLSSRLYVLFIVYVFSLHLSVLSLFLSSHCICLFSFRF